MERRGRTISAVAIEANDARALRGHKFFAGLRIYGQRIERHDSGINELGT